MSCVRPCLANASVRATIDVVGGARSAVRAKRHEAGLDPALRRPSLRAEARSVVGRSSCPHDSSLRSSPCGHDEKK